LNLRAEKDLTVNKEKTIPGRSSNKYKGPEGERDQKILGIHGRPVPKTS
jgi:hypothetical protein